MNLPSNQLGEAGLVAAVMEALARSGLPAGRLELEATGAAIADSRGTHAILHELKALGVRLALTDFGAGPASLRNLQDLPFDRVKIDRSFIEGLCHRPEAVVILRAVTTLCAGLGIATTAEGVETDAELAVLRAEGCDEAQGSLFGMPRPCAQPALAPARMIVAAEGTQ